MKHRTILSLCDFTGEWSRPYREAGYNVIQVDLKHGQDVRLLKYPGRIHGALIAAPCTHMAVSGARWWEAKGEAAILESLAISDACLRFALLCKPTWWVLENPVGRLPDYYGPATFTFNPCDYALLADNPGEEAYTKKTCLWGEFTAPTPLILGQDYSVKPVLGSKMHLIPPGPERQALRSVTPSGFAKAFWRANP